MIARFLLLPIPGSATIAVLAEDVNGNLKAAPQTAANWNAALDAVKSLLGAVPTKVFIEAELPG